MAVPELPRSSALAATLKSTQADAVNAQLSGRHAFDADAHRLERRERRETVLAFQES